MAWGGKSTDNLPHEVVVFGDTAKFKIIDQWLRSPEAVGKFYYEGFVVSEGYFRVYWLSNANTAFAFRLKFS